MNETMINAMIKTERDYYKKKCSDLELRLKMLVLSDSAEVTRKRAKELKRDGVQIYGYSEYGHCMMKLPAIPNGMDSGFYILR